MLNSTIDEFTKVDLGKESGSVELRRRFADAQQLNTLVTSVGTGTSILIQYLIEPTSLTADVKLTYARALIDERATAAQLTDYSVVQRTLLDPNSETFKEWHANQALATALVGLATEQPPNEGPLGPARIVTRFSASAARWLRDATDAFRELSASVSAAVDHLKITTTQRSHVELIQGLVVGLASLLWVVLISRR